jgi:hypothetical protein
MATFQTYQSIGNREDLTDVIYNISPTDTPFMSSVGKTKASAVYHEWQTDSLAAAAQNAVVEGAAASSLTVSPTTRVGNRTQISQKTVKIAGTQEAIDKAGRKSEKAYQLAKASAELKRDMEKILLDNTAAVTGDATTARKLGSLQAWINTNASVGATAGAAGSLGTTARTSGDDRTFTEALLKANVKSVYSAGGNPTVLMVTPTQKQVVSAFAGVAAQRYMAPSEKPTTIVGAADVYLSDFGTLSVVPNRFMTADSGDSGEQAFVLDPEYAAIAYLRPFQTNELARTGDAEETQLLVEYTLEVKNEAAHGLIADLAE